MHALVVRHCHLALFPQDYLNMIGVLDQMMTRFHFPYFLVCFDILVLTLTPPSPNTNREGVDSSSRHPKMKE